MKWSLNIALLFASFACVPLAAAEYEDSRISLLPEVLPALSRQSPLEEARAQALLAFLRSHSRYGKADCDIEYDLCLPDFVPEDGPSVLPAQQQTLLHAPVDGPLVISFAEDAQTEVPLQGSTFIARNGQLLHAPFAGTIAHIDRLSAGRTRLSIRHAQADNLLALSILQGQFETYLGLGDRVAAGQPLGRARPNRKASTRMLYQLYIGEKTVNPENWLRPTPEE